MVHGEKTFTQSGNMRAPPLEMFCSFVIKAWDKVKTESIIKSFKKCSISNALDGSEDDTLWEDDEDDLTNEITDNDVDEWDPYYDYAVDHAYLENYMQEVVDNVDVNF